MKSWNTGVAMIVGLLLFGAPALRGAGTSELSMVLILDEDALDNGQAPNFLSSQETNDHIASEGLRDSLPYFAANIGSHLHLPAFQAGDAGWFALEAAPSGWADAETAGLRNFVLAGPGLGSPDDDGNRTSLLGDVAGVRTLGIGDLQAMSGQAVCAVVYDQDVIIDAVGAADLKGATLGVVALRVIDVTAEGQSSPSVEVEILDASVVCGAE